MVRNYIKIAWRNLLRNKVSSIINISGLAIGIASVLLIGMYVKDELSYDRFSKDADHIFRVNLDGKMGNDQFIAGHTPPPAGAALVNNFPEIESYTRIFLPGDEIIHNENGLQKRSIIEKHLLAVDSNFVKFFGYPLVAGDAATCLKDINSIVLTQTAAKKYFGDVSPIGKTLAIDEYQSPFKVTAILKDLPQQSSLQFDMLQNTASIPPIQRKLWSWVWLQMGTYVKFKSSAAVDAQSIAKLEAKLPAMVALQAASAFKRIGQPWEEFKKKGGKWDLKLQPLTDLHLYSANVGTRYFVQGDIKYVYIFSAVGIFIILLACVNFMNLSTARSAKRAKEVGIRKVLGSARKQLIRQFLVEALIYSLLATVIAVLVVILALPAFNQLSGKALSANVFLDIRTWLVILSLITMTGLLAGSYPAFFLTSFKPVSVLKGAGILKDSASSFFTRNVLVVFQFTVSTVLIICTIVVYKQLVYNQTKDLGFNKENVIILANAERLGNNEESLRQELLKLPQVADASISTSLPTKNSFGDTYAPEANPGNVNGGENNIMLSSFIVDESFLSTLKLKVVSGRAFSKSFTDSASVILNETAAKQIGWKDPIGKTMIYMGNNNQKFTVVGVIKDFNTESFRSNISPFALFYKTSKTYQTGASYITVRIKPGNYNTTIDQIQNGWKLFSSGTPFDYSFMDAEFDALYRSDQTMGKVFSVFTFLSLFIACLGLLGLAIYTAERRTKEIGIRKVLGASVQNVVSMLSLDFVKLIIIASVIAFPVAWYAMNKWLQDFAFRTNISWWVFILASASTLCIALITIGFQSVKAALGNPVKSLRSE
ncbi:ABC transporter permease [Mucilaginibacter sp. BJC16-A38]|uniref:ABC transporter permease n=1 Tax=Mucilaginibacter phenanthrenivorans TaxID=1234842 RepID=UPI002157F2A3|nr:ABC transporter permease [Mucilaginibacter phenanthrenivorans]MCR8556872.1 ABC transporter permease [Mucilaginibacter phenanthrenivorans]